MRAGTRVSSAIWHRVPPGPCRGLAFLRCLLRRCLLRLLPCRPELLHSRLPLRHAHKQPLALASASSIRHTFIPSLEIPRSRPSRARSDVGPPRSRGRPRVRFAHCCPSSSSEPEDLSLPRRELLLDQQATFLQIGEAGRLGQRPSPLEGRRATYSHDARTETVDEGRRSRASRRGSDDDNRGNQVHGASVPNRCADLWLHRRAAGQNPTPASTQRKVFLL